MALLLQSSKGDRMNWAKWERARMSYNYCRICGHTPGSKDEPNRGPIIIWEPDDGLVIGTLCRWCFEEFGNVEPNEGDYAYGDDDIEIETDEDPLTALG